MYVYSYIFTYISDKIIKRIKTSQTQDYMEKKSYIHTHNIIP